MYYEIAIRLKIPAASESSSEVIPCVSIVKDQSLLYDSRMNTRRDWKEGLSRKRKMLNFFVVDLSDPNKEKTTPMNDMVQEETSTHENSHLGHEHYSDANSVHSASGQHFDDDAMGRFVLNWSRG